MDHRDSQHENTPEQIDRASVLELDDADDD